MRRFVITLGLVCLFMCLFRSPPARAQSPDASQPAGRKRALLIGISDYCRGAGAECEQGGKYWWNLSGAEDAEALKAVLSGERFAFEPITTLATREATTRQAIKKAFESLIADTKKGDVVYIHYSGHGSQTPDDERAGNLKVGDELDGLDETIVPSDYASQKDGANDIRDDELEQWIAELMAKEPASVTMTFDSCHSGTTTRNGAMRPRGGPYQGPLPAARPAGSAGRDVAGGLFNAKFADRRGLVVIAASRDDQLAQEWIDKTRTPRGVLTHSFISAINASGGRTTYRDLFDRISDEVTRAARNQNPQMEGNGLLELFSGRVAPPARFVRVGVEGSRVFLKAGFLQGMTRRSRFDLYPPGVTGADPAKRLAQAEIIQVERGTSRLKIIPPPDEAKLAELNNAAAFETLHQLGEAKLRVEAGAVAQLARGGEIVSGIKGVELFTTDAGADAWDVRICKGNCPEEGAEARRVPAAGESFYTLQRDDGTVIVRVADDATAAAEISRALRAEARYRFIKQLKNTDQKIAVEFRLVPVEVTFADDRSIAGFKRLGDEFARGEGNHIRLYVDDFYMVETRNLGTQTAFVTILDLRADGVIGPVWPHPQVPVGSGGENRVPADGKWRLIPSPFIFRVTGPAGSLSFKAISTLDQSDFSPLIHRDAPSAAERGLSGAAKSVGRFLVASSRGPERGEADSASGMALPPDGWSTYEIVVQVRPASEKR